jgi:hypothetical protein
MRFLALSPVAVRISSNPQCLLKMDDYCGVLRILHVIIGRKHPSPRSRETRKRNGVESAHNGWW